jgi:hypothetical protein
VGAEHSGANVAYDGLFALDVRHHVLTRGAYASCCLELGIEVAGPVVGVLDQPIAEHSVPDHFRAVG